MNADHERLQEIYEEKSDEALHEMWERRDDLTDQAQDALKDVMKRRGLSTAATYEAAVEASAIPTVEADELLLWTFGDMFQARRAIQLLEEAELDYKLNDLSQGAAAASWRGGTEAWLQLLVPQRHYAAAKKILQQGMGLFPGAEAHSASESDVPFGELMSVLMLDAETELASGLAAAQALARNGVSFLWHDGRDMPEGLADAHTISIEVRAESYEQAAAIVQKAMG
jgi:hypothetical protein